MPRRLPNPNSLLNSASAAMNSTIASGLSPPPSPNKETAPRMTNTHTSPISGAKAANGR